MDEATAFSAIETTVASREPEGRPLGRGFAPRRAGVWTWSFRIALVAMVIVSIALLRDELPDPAAMWTLAIRADPLWLVVVVAAKAVSMGAFARLQRRLLLTGGVRISLRRAAAVTYAGNALSTTLPAGPAVSALYSFRQFRRGGASVQVATAVIVFGGITTSAAYTLVALVALLGERHSRGPAAVALAGTAAAAVLVWRSPRTRWALCRHAGRALAAALRHRRTAPVARSLQRAGEVMRPTGRDWGVVTVLAVLNWIFEILALLAAAWAVGLNVAPQHVTLAYFAAQAAGSLLPLLPGGLGAIEAGLVTTLMAFGAAAVPASAAVAVYRLVSYWAVVAIGWLAWLVLRASDETLRVLQDRLAASLRSAASGLAAATPVWVLGPGTVTSSPLAAASPADRGGRADRAPR